MRHFSEIVPGVLVATSSELTSTSTAVLSADGGCLLIDPAVTVAELGVIAAELGGLGQLPAAGFATHPHWDHILWSRELGDVPRYAAPAGLEILESIRDEMIPHLERTAPGHDMELYGRGLTALAANAEQIPWAGPVARLIVHDAHAPGHGALLIEDAGVLVAGDMLSDIEIPLLDTFADDPLGDYRTGLERLAAAPGVRWVVPGHGSVGDAAEFRQRLDADNHYLDLLAAGRPFEDARCNLPWLRASHRSHLIEVGGLTEAELGPPE